MTVTILQGDCLEVLRKLPSESVHCCVTSPPYWGLRDYGHDGQLGLERTPEEYVDKMVEVFTEVRRVLRSDGTLWLNLGDSYNAYNAGAGPNAGFSKGAACDTQRPKLESGYGRRCLTLKPKDLVGIPWRLAFALQADGWYLRQDIIWAKPNPMPESVKDRCTKSHEYIFLMSKSERYDFDWLAIAEPVAESSVERLGQCVEIQKGSDRVPGKTNGKMKAVKFGGNKADGYGTRIHSGKEWTPKQQAGNLSQNRDDARADGADHDNPFGLKANKRSVWTVTTQPYKGAHFAVFPPKLIEPCILAGCPEGGTVLDPFFGSGTTGEVATKNGCHCIGIELNPEYVELAKKRNQQRSLIA